MSVPASLQVLLGGSLLQPMLLVLPGETAGRMVMSPAVGVSVAVEDSLGNPVDVFADDTLTGAPLAQPLASDAQGRVAGFVAQPQRLFVTTTGTGITSRTFEVGLDRDPVSITDVHVVGGDAAMLAIAGAHEGTVAVRTDLENRAFMNNGGTSGTDADWTEIGFGNVLSVNGASGDVTIHLNDLAATADVALGGHKLTGIGDATAGTDALNRETGDGRYDAIGAAATAQTAAIAASDPVGAALANRNQAIALGMAIGG